MKRLMILSIAVLLIATGCCNRAYTKASKDFATVVGGELSMLDNPTVQATLEDDCVTYEEGKILYETLESPYLNYIGNTIDFNDFDARIRLRLLTDYKEATYGRED